MQELGNQQPTGQASQGDHGAEKIVVPDTVYASDFWRGVDDEGLDGSR